MKYAYSNDGFSFRHVDEDMATPDEIIFNHEPTENELLKAFPARCNVIGLAELERVKLLRAEAFSTEADPLYFKWQRGEATETEWRAKVDEIRARFPYLS